jgi:hypothetical protein
MTDEQMRTYARLGALEMCRRAVTEFPDILADLKAMAVRAVGTPDAVTSRAAAQVLVDRDLADAVATRDVVGYMRTAQGVLPIPSEVKNVRQLFLDAAAAQPPARRTMSAEARAKISAGMKRRWKLRGAR